MSDSKLVLWKTEPDDHDYPAAADYLALLADAATVEAIVDELKSAPIVYKKAKDILRASRLRLLPGQPARAVRSDEDSQTQGAFADLAGPR